MAKKTTAKQPAKGEKKAAKGQKTTGRRMDAVQKMQERRAQTQLRNRMIAGVILVFLALFLLLSMLGIHAVALDALKKLMRGIFGYGYYLLPFALCMVAWLLVFRNHEPYRLRTAGLFCGIVFFSGMLHVLLSYAGLGAGKELIPSLWRTGMAGTSGGVIPGLIAYGLIHTISKAGAFPVLLVLLLAAVFLAFRIDGAMLIHRRAEKRRKKLEENLPQSQPEPVVLTQEMTMEDLRILATPAGRPVRQERESVSVPRERRRGVGSPLKMGGREPWNTPGEESGIRKENGEESGSFFESFRRPGGEKKKKRGQEPELPEEQEADVLPVEDYTAQVQQLVREPQQDRQPETAAFNVQQNENSWLNLPREEADHSPAEMLTDSEIAAGAEAAQKDGKVTKNEAAQAAEQVAKEIEARTDAEAEVDATPPYQYPPMTMLSEAMGSKEDNTEEMRTNVVRLEETLRSFNVDIKVENVVRGPTVTRYEMELRPGIKMSKITSLHEDIALALGVSSVRVAAVEGKSSIIGIEVPNGITTSVPIREVLSSEAFRKNSSPLAFAAGKDIGGNYIVGDIAKMPHLLIAGTTGSGKSVCMNSIIVSLLYRATPDEVRLIMIDPKMVELSIYNGIPHLLIPVVTDAKKAAGALQWAVTEMERRYQLLADYKVRDVKGYNALARRDESMTPMPRIVVIIDELADLMLVAAKEVENSIVRIAQKARAAGMHLVIATQRPSTDVITGIMKANIPSRIAFAVSSAIDSRIILDESGAEKLVGKGDMLYAPLGAGKPIRVQGCFITDEEAEEVAEFVKNSAEADYSDEILREIDQNVADGGSGSKADPDQTALKLDGDPLLPDAVEVVLDTGQASTSMLQRRLKLGYAHAARIVDELEEKGIVGPFEGSKARQVLITREQWDTMVGLNPKAKAPEPEAETGSPAEDDDVPFDED